MRPASGFAATDVRLRRRAVAVALLTASFVGAFLLLAADPATAIPAFARKYQISCTTCHAPFPRLKPYGEEFAARGFRMADAAQEPTRAKHDVGDPWLELMRDLPLAARTEGHVAYREDAAAETDLETPWVFKLLSGGPLSPKISYYLYFILEKGDVEGLEDAYLHFQKLFGSGIDLLFGQFQVSDPLFKRELRLSRADYEIYRTRIGEARANLTYDRGLMFFATAPGDVDVVFEVVNGNGIPKGEFDQDSDKNVALRLAREVGPVRLGLFGYLGREKNEAGASDEIRYFGPDLKWTPNDRWDLSLQFLERRDDNPWFLAHPGDEVVTRGGFAELVFLPQGADGRWAVTALYNRIRSDDPAAELEDAALSLSYLTARNFRLIGELGHDFDREADRLSFGVVAAF
jgi:hypothetical protein